MVDFNIKVYGFAKKHFIFIYFILILSLYILFIFKFISPWHHLYSDMDGYVFRALSFAQHKPYWEYDTFYPAGLTYLFAPFFLIFKYEIALKLVAIFQCFLLASTSIYLFKIIRELFSFKYASYFLLIFSSIYFPFISYLGFYLSEISFIFFLVASIYYILRIAKGSATTFDSLLAGLFFGIALIIKGTILLTLLFLIGIFILLFRKIGWLKICIFGLVVLILIVTQVCRNSVILGKPTFISTNGGINTYLGQAHLLRVYNANKYGISYFANNNYFYDKTLIKEETFDFPVWEQEKFFSMVEKLWQENPIRQLKISIKNASDLFLIVPHWPIRDTGEYKKLDISAQWAFLFLVYLPSLLTLILSFRNKGFLTEILILFAFIFGAVIIAAITKGEERYMVPFQYVFILLAAPFWEKTLQFLCFSLRIKSRKSLG